MIRTSLSRNSQLDIAADVLVTLAGSVGLAIPLSTTTAMESAKLDLLEQMLQTAIQNNISLSSDVLRSMAVSCSCSLSETNKEIRWKLLEKISRLDEDIFCASGEADNSKLLDSLLPQITNLAIPEYEGDLDDNCSIARTILMRMLQAFARAHNVTGFIAHWQKELETVERRRLSYGIGDAPTATRFFSVWEDEDLILGAGSLLGKFLTLKQTKEVLASSEFNIIQFMDEVPDPERNVKVFVSLVTLDAVFSGANQDGDAALDMIEENIRSVHGTLLRLVSHTSCLKSHRWRIWRVISRIQEFWQVAIAARSDSGLNINSSSSVQEFMGRNIHSLIQAALENAHSSLTRALPGIKRSRRDPQRYFEALPAFDFILYMARVYGSVTATRAGKSTKAATPDILNRSVELLMLCLSRLRASVEHHIPIWNGKLRGLTGEQALGVAVTARLMAYCPEVLLQISSTARKRLFLLIHELASLTCSNWEQRTPQTCQLSFVRIWDGILSNENLLRHAKLKDEVIGTLLEFLCVGRSGVNAPGSDVKALAALNLMKLPLEVFQRDQRERVLNVLIETLFSAQTECGKSNDSLTDQISLILKFMDVPNASATLATDPKVIWNLSEIIGQSGPYPTTLAFSGFGDIVKKNLGQLLLTKDQERSRQYLMSFSESLRDYLTDILSLENNLGHLQLIRSSLVMLWPRLEALSRDMGDVLQDACGKYLRLLLSDLRSWKQGLERDHASARLSLRALAEAVIEFPGLGSTTVEEIRVMLQAIGETVSPLFPGLLPLPDDGGEEERRDCQKLSISRSSEATCFDHSLGKIIYTAWLSVYLLKLDDGRVPDLSVRTLTERPSLARPDRGGFLTTFYSFTMSLERSGKLSLLLYLERMAFQGIAFSGECFILLLRALIISYGNANAPAQPADISKALSSLYSKLCLNLCEVKGFRQFRLVINTMDLITRKKPGAITQWNIDQTLGAIASTASSSGPRIPTNRSGAVYLSLCGTMRGILAGHRLKLRGRFHLVIPLMQNLLRCLFLPKRSTENKAEAHVTIPPWLSFDIVAAAPYAIAYAQLLCMLCDPTASSVAIPRNRHRQELTPATAKARRIAGQYLPHLLKEYIQCQIRYRLLPEVKSAITPGLYAVLEVSSPETLRMVNAAMDASGRALFKILYSDYGRFGKWKEQ